MSPSSPEPVKFRHLPVLAWKFVDLFQYFHESEHQRRRIPRPQLARHAGVASIYLKLVSEVVANGVQLGAAVAGLYGVSEVLLFHHSPRGSQW